MLIKNLELSKRHLKRAQNCFLKSFDLVDTASSMLKICEWINDSVCVCFYMSVYNQLYIERKGHIPGLVLYLIHCISSSWGKLLNSPIMFHWLWRFAQPCIDITVRMPKITFSKRTLQKSQPKSWNERNHLFLILIWRVL